MVTNPHKYIDGGACSDMHEWIPNLLLDNEYLVCALRSWHQVYRTKSNLELEDLQSSWTSDALDVRAVGEWRDDERDVTEVAP